MLHEARLSLVARVIQQRMSIRPEAGYVVAVVLLVVATAWLTVRFIRLRDRQARVRRAARAARAERAARGVLEHAGFRVRGEQVRKSWALSADGERVRFELVADYVVERDGRAWVAEVKTGERALDLRFGPTRRQLLEYREAFGVEGVLLVDAEANSLREIHFHAPERVSSRSAAILWFLAGAGVAGVVAIWLTAS